MRADTEILWETYDHHQKLKKHESYPGLIASLKLAMSGDLNVQHVDFDEDAAAVFTSGATEVITLTPHPEVELKEFHDTLKTLRELLATENSCKSSALGESREKKGTWFWIIGWDSVQAHQDAVAEDAALKVIKQLTSLAEVEVKHVKLVKYAA
ncbi:hypothetical protein H0H87_006162 [Tephrocybe sp. NHM501043]|nr:hypothetical protein H0H87_006162 [Tephrocybe sp. NHM501043]